MTFSLLSIVSAGIGGWCVSLVFSQTILWLTAGFAVWLLRRSSAAVRHRVWSLSALVALALPLTVGTVPALRLGWIKSVTGGTAPEITRTDASGSGYSPLSAGQPPDFDLTQRFLDRGAPQSAGPENPGADDAASSALPRAGSQPGIRLTGILGVWLVFIPAILGLWRIARAVLAARQISACSLPIDEAECHQTCSTVAAGFGWRGTVNLSQSGQTRVPLCLGWTNPRIILPADWRTWPPETLRAVIAHEMAHVVRQDVAWQLVARLTCALYWFQPLAWLAAWRMRVEREYACDDSVLRAGERPIAYARILLDVASRLNAGTSIPGAAAAMVVQSGLERRVRAILATNRARLPVGRRAGQALFLATLLAIVFSSTVSPFSNTIKRAHAAGSLEAAQPEFPGDEVPGAETPSTIKPESTAKPAKNYSPTMARLFIADSDGSGMKPLDVLPEYGYQGSPKWSPDGKQIAFNVWKEGEDFTSGQIALVDADGGNPRVLIDGLMPSFSPRGDRLAFSRPGSDHGVWVVNTEGPAKELLQIDENGWGTDWSPDGKLVYSIGAAGGANLAVFDLADKRRQLLFDEQQSPYKNVFWSMAWSPDSSRIAFKGLTTNGKYEVGIVDARGEKLGLRHRIEGGVTATFAWSPDGSRVLFCKACPQRAYRSQMYVLEADSDDPPQLLAGQDPRLNYVDVAWSRDGKKILASAMQPASKSQAEQANISPERLKDRFVANFRKEQPDANVERLIANADPRYASLGVEGLRLHLPAGDEKPDRAGISTKFEIRGDFELIAVFHSLTAHKPAEGWGAGLHLLLQLGTGPKDFILVERMLSGAGESVFATKHGHVDFDGQYQWKIIHHPPNEVAAGKIKVVRKGSVVYYLFAEYGTDEYSLFDEKVISDADIQLLKLEACAKDRQAGSELILDKLEIRAEQLPGMVK